MSKRLVFMGTPEFAIPSLERVLSMKEVSVIAVYTQPDKEAGRGKKLVSTPVKNFAVEHGLNLRQPQTLRSDEAVAQMRELNPDIILVAAYGKIIPSTILEIPGYGCLNIHPSLLPKYRGATPVQSAILNGDSITGVTIMLLDAGMDSGPILKQREEPINDADTAQSLMQRLAFAGAELVAEVLPLWLEGKIQPVKQDEELATYTRPLSKEDGRIDWSMSAVDIWRRVRAYQPWPGAWTIWKDKMLKINNALLVEMTAAGKAGDVIALKGNADMPAGVICGKGILGLREVQLEGKKAMRIEEFLRGQRDFIGSKLL